MSGDDGVLRIRLLAGVEATIDDTPVELGGKRQRAVLAVLGLAAPAPVSIDRLIAGVWGDEPPASASGTLQSYVSRLRRVLGSEAIELTTAGYALRVDPDAVDLARFRSIIAAAREDADAHEHDAAVGQLRAALADWSASPLGDLIDAPFATPAIAVLSEERSAAVELLYRLELERGGGVDLVAELEAAVADDPLHEELWRHLVVALYRSNRVADALRAYQRAHEALVDVGLAPGDALRDVGRRVAASDPTLLRATDPLDVVAPGPNPGNLLPRGDAFVGRSETLDELAELVRPGTVVTLLGPGGVGKTRLAEEHLRRVNAEFPDGTWMVELAPVDRSQVGAAVADALGLDHLDVAGPDEVAQALDAQKLVLALDNCEPMCDEVAHLVRAIQRRAPDLAVVVTSQVPLGVDDEILVLVDPLDVPSPDAGADAVADHDASRLFEQRAARLHAGFRITSLNAPAIGRIVRRLDGLPLAIEMAASLVGLRTPQQIAATIEDRFGLVHPDAADPRHATLRAMLDWSYELLTAEQQELFARLSVFAGGFDAETAAAVCAEPLPNRLQEQLELLWLRSLIRRSTGAEARYSMLDTMRAYGRDLLARRDELDSMRDQHLAMVRDLAQELAGELRGREQAAVFSRLRAERFEIQQALGWAASQGRSDDLVRIAVALARWWRVDLAPDDEGRRWVELALEHAVSDADEAMLAIATATLLRGTDRRRAQQLAERAERAVRRLDGTADARTVARLLAAVGEVCTMIDDYDRAAALLGEARDWSVEHGDDWIRGFAGLRLFRVLATQAPPIEVAEEAAADFVAALERAGDLHLLATAQLARATMYRFHGRPADALAAVRTGRSSSAPLGLVYVDAEALTTEAELTLALGDLDAAAEAIAALGTVVERRVWRDGREWRAGLDAELALARGDVEAAHRALQRLVTESDRPDALELTSMVALAAALAGEQPDLVAPDDPTFDPLWPWERIEMLYRLAVAAWASGRDPFVHLGAALELCTTVDAPIWQVVVTQFTLHVIETDGRAGDELTEQAAAFARSLGARPRAWETAWRGVPDGPAERLDPDAAAAMCARALALLPRAPSS